jgi:hypothetical protein
MVCPSFYDNALHHFDISPGLIIFTNAFLQSKYKI